MTGLRSPSTGRGRGGARGDVPRLYLDLLLQQVDFVLLLDELLLLLGDLAEGRQRGSAAPTAAPSWPRQGYGPARAAQHPQNSDKGSAEGPEGHGEGRRGGGEGAELPPEPPPWTWGKKRAGRDGVTPTLGCAMSVTPALSIIWATGEGKVGVKEQREQSREGPSAV